MALSADELLDAAGGAPAGPTADELLGSGPGAKMVLASIYADPTDLATYRRARAAGLSDQEAIRRGYGDNGVTAYGDNSTNPNDPIVALPSDTPGFAHNRLVEFTGPDGRTGVGRLSEKMPPTDRLKGDASIDLNPAAAKLIGHPGGVYPVAWRFIDDPGTASTKQAKPTADELLGAPPTAARPTADELLGAPPTEQTTPAPADQGGFTPAGFIQAGLTNLARGALGGLEAATGNLMRSDLGKGLAVSGAGGQFADFSGPDTPTPQEIYDAAAAGGAALKARGQETLAATPEGFARGAGAIAGGLVPFAVAEAAGGPALTLPLLFESGYQEHIDDAAAKGQDGTKAAIAGGALNLALGLPIFKVVNGAAQAIVPNAARYVQESMGKIFQAEGIQGVQRVTRILQDYGEGRWTKETADALQSALRGIDAEIKAPVTAALRRVIRQTAESAAIGGTVTTGQNLLAQTYDPERPTFQGVPEALATFGALGAIGATGEQFGRVRNAREAQDYLRQYYHEKSVNSAASTVEPQAAPLLPPPAAAPPIVPPGPPTVQPGPPTVQPGPPIGPPTSPSGQPEPPSGQPEPPSGPTALGMIEQRMGTPPEPPPTEPPPTEPPPPIVQPVPPDPTPLTPAPPPESPLAPPVVPPGNETIPVEPGIVTSVPMSQVAIRPGLMQFKQSDDPTKGTNANDRITTPYDPLKAGVTLLWEPQNPAQYDLAPGQRYIVVNGHHRHDARVQQNVPTFNAQILREADGVSVIDARRTGAEINIADGKSTIYDQANFIRDTATVAGADVALARAREIGARGRKASNIALAASDDLYTAFINERISPEHAEAIALAAPRQPHLQLVGLHETLLDNLTPQEAANMVESVKAKIGALPTPQQVEMFGRDETALEEARARRRKANKVQKAIGEQIASVSGAARRPEIARKLGVDVKDPGAIQKRITQLQQLREIWSHWGKDQGLVKQLDTMEPDEIVRQGIETIGTRPTLSPPGPPDEFLDRLREERITKPRLANSAMRNRITGRIYKGETANTPHADIAIPGGEDELDLQPGWTDTAGKFLNRAQAHTRAIQTAQVGADDPIDELVRDEPGLHAGDLREDRLREEAITPEQRRRYRKLIAKRDEGKIKPAESVELEMIERAMGQSFLVPEPTVTDPGLLAVNQAAAKRREKEIQALELKRRLNQRLVGGDVETQTGMFGPETDKGGNLTLFEKPTLKPELDTPERRLAQLSELRDLSMGADIGPDEGRWLAIQNSYIIARAAERALPSVPLKQIFGLQVHDKQGAVPGKEPQVDLFFVRRGEIQALSKKLRTIYPPDRYTEKLITSVVPYSPRTGEPTYKQWLAGARPDTAALLKSARERAAARAAAKKAAEPQLRLLEDPGASLRDPETIREIRAHLAGPSPAELEMQSRRHWIAREATGEPIELFGTRQEADDYMRTMAAAGEELVLREPGKPDKVLKRIPHTVASAHHAAVVKAGAYYLTGEPLRAKLRHGNAAALRRQEGAPSAGSETAPGATDVSSGENALAQNLFGKNYDELSDGELRQLHDVRVRDLEEAPGDVQIFTNQADGIQSEIRQRQDGKFAVVLRDLDSNQVVPLIHIEATLEKAIARAKSLVADLPNKPKRARKKYVSPAQLQFDLFAGKADIGTATPIQTLGAGYASQPGGTGSPPAHPGILPETGLADPRATRLRALAFQRSLIAGEKSSALLGKPVYSADMLARHLQVYRDPRWETFRWIFVDRVTRKIVRVIPVSARLPGTTAVFEHIPGISAAAQFTQMHHLAILLNADIWQMHNHPGLNPKSSDTDRSFNRDASRLLGARFKGHVIIDHGKYHFMAPNYPDGTEPPETGNYKIDNDLALGSPEPGMAHFLLGKEVWDAADMVEVGKYLSVPSGYFSVVSVDNQLHVRAIHDIDIERFRDTDSIAAELRTLGREVGARRMIVYHDGSPLDVSLKFNLAKLTQEHVLWDAVLVPTKTLSGAEKPPGNMWIGENTDLINGMIVDEKVQQGTTIRIGNRRDGYREVELRQLDKIPIADLPALVSLTRELGLDAPRVQRLAQARGYFRPGATQEIALDFRLFADPVVAAKVLAHEIGHLSDYLPEGTMKRGNLLGRLASLREYLTTTLPIDPKSGEQAMTKEDRDRLRKEAQRTAGPRPKKHASDEEKKAWSAAVNKAYLELLNEEIKSRGLAADRETGKNVANNVREELIALSDWWKPFLDDAAAGSLSPGYIDYRTSGVELYADMISVLLNSPADVKARAPVTFETFFNYLDRKPEVREAFFQMWDMLGPDADRRAVSRQQQVRAMFQKGEEILNRAIDDRIKTATWREWVNALRGGMDTRYWPAISRERTAAKGGSRAAALAPLEWLFDAHPLADNTVYVWMHNLNEAVRKPLLDAGLIETDLGEYLFFDRIANESYDISKALQQRMENDQGGRAHLANPAGHTPKSAQEQLAFLESKLGSAAYKKLQAAAAVFRSHFFDVVERMRNEGMIGDEAWAIVAQNKDSYATFLALAYADLHVPAGIKQQIGYLGDIANPYTATVLKGITALRAIEFNKAKRVTITHLKDYFPGEVTIAPGKWNGRRSVPQEPRDPELALVTFMSAGKQAGVHVARDIHDMLEYNESSAVEVLTKILSPVHWLWQQVFYPTYITFSPLFQLFRNPIRDIRRTALNLPDQARILDAVSIRWGETRKMVRDWVHEGKITPDILAALDARAVPPPMGTWQRAMAGEDMFIAIASRFGLARPGAVQQGHWVERLPVVGKLFRSLAATGQIRELVPKIGAYRLLTQELGFSPEDAAGYVRNYIGTPNWIKKGTWTHLANDIFPFVNVWSKGWQADTRMLRGRAQSPSGARPKTAGSWWLRWLLTGALPKILMAAAAAGIMGETLRRLYGRVGGYWMQNYDVIPLGERPGGTIDGQVTVFMPIPKDFTDRLLGGLTYLLARAAFDWAKGNRQVVRPTDPVSLGTSDMPSVNPALKISAGWSTYLAGGNPYDSFRSQQVLTDQQIQAGWKFSLPGMLAWTWGQQGASTFIQYNPNLTTVTETVMSAIPGINGMIKWSDTGLREAAGRAETDQAGVRARIALNMPQPVQQLRTEYNWLKSVNEAQRTPTMQARYKVLAAWDKNVYEPFVEASKYDGQDHGAAVLQLSKPYLTLGR